MNFFDLPTLIQSAGYIGVGLIIFAESGLFFGFFLPGDTLLFTAGFLAAQGLFDIGILTTIIVVAAILGDQVGYWTGMKAGPYIFKREDSFWFSKNRLEQARAFFELHGGKSVILARFVPFARTFTPIVAGAVGMRYASFVAYNIVGGLLWGVGVTVAGYILGEIVPDIDRYLIPAVIAGFILFTGFTTAIPLIKRFVELRNSKKIPRSDTID